MRQTSSIAALQKINKAFAKLICLVLAIALASAALCACGQQSAVEPTPTATVSPTPIPMPKNGGELTIPMPENANVFDPLTVNTEELKLMFSLVFESLVSVDEANILTPCLAQSWTLDNAGKTFTVNLRQNALFHADGKPLTSRDVVYSINKIKSLGDASYYAYHVSAIDTVSATGDFSLTISMKNPGLSSLYLMTFPIVRENDELSSTPNGTGPYTVASAAASRVELRANESWWRERPYISRVTFLAKLNNETAVASYEAGQLNFVPTSILSVGRYREDGVTKVVDIMTNEMELMLFNSKNALLNDVQLRTAIAYALDRNSVVSNTYMNKAHAADVPIPPDSFIYDSQSLVFEYNAERASSILSSAGYVDSNGDSILEKGGIKLSFDLLVNETFDNIARKSAASMFKEQLAKVGIEINIVSAEYSISSQEEQEYIRKLNEGDFDIALVGINLPQSFDLSAFLSADGSRNYGKMYDAELYSLAGAISSALTEQDMRAAALEFSLNFVEKIPFLVLYFRLNSIVTTAKLQNIDDIREPDIARTIYSWWLSD